MSDRRHGKLGATLKPKPVELRWLSELLTNPLPPASTAVDHTFARKSWGMLGNDRYGDCAVAGIVHLREVHARIVAKSEKWPSDAQTVKQYLAYTGGNDDGCVLSELLLYWHQHGLFNDKVPAFAPLKVKNDAEVKSAVQTFGAVYLGVDVPKPAMQQFDRGLAWELTGTPADDDIEGGHCIVLAKYDGARAGALTWGAVQPLSWRWYQRYAREAWVALSSEFLASKAIDVAALKADIAKLGGT